VWFADQGVELIQVDRVSQQRNIGDQRSLETLMVSQVAAYRRTGAGFKADGDADRASRGDPDV
jgi:hypothetical protein